MVDELEREDRLRIYDWYSLTLGRKSTENHPAPSLKITDLSPEYSSWIKSDELGESKDTLRIMENGSVLARFNDERVFADFILTRVFPRSPVWKATIIASFVRGVHNESTYRVLEAGADGVVDFRLDETSDPPENLMRVRSLRSAPYDGRWHKLKTAENMEVTMES